MLVVAKHPNSILTQISHKQELAGRVWEDAVQVTPILPRSHGANGSRVRKDNLSWLRETAIVIREAIYADGASVTVYGCVSCVSYVERAKTAGSKKKKE